MKKILYKKTKYVMLLVSLVFIYAIVRYTPSVSDASDEAKMELSIETSNDSVTLTYGYSLDNYLDYTIKNTGNKDLNNVELDFEGNVSNIEYEKPLNIAKDHSANVRVYFNENLVAGQYVLKFNYRVKEQDENEYVIEGSSNVCYEVKKRSLVITVPDKTISLGAEVPAVEPSELDVQGLIAGNELQDSVHGLRTINYVVTDVNEAGEYNSEDISGELSSSNYNIEFIPGKLIITDIDKDATGESTENSIDNPEEDTQSDAENDIEGKNEETKDTTDEVSENDSDTEKVIVADTTAPTVSVLSEDMKMIAGVFVGDKAGEVLFEVVDIAGCENEDVSGVKGVWYSLDGGNRVLISAVDNIARLQLPEKYCGNIFYQAEDNVGNTSEVAWVTVELRDTLQSENGDEDLPEENTEMLDNEIPEVKISSEDMKLIGDTFVAEEAGSIKFEVFDEDSGALGVEYYIEDEEQFIYTKDGIATLNLEKDFEGTIYYAGEDNAGNISEQYAVHIDLASTKDVTSPTVMVTSQTLDNIGHIFFAGKDESSLKFTVTDPDPEDGTEVSGIDYLYIYLEATGKSGVYEPVNGTYTINIANSYRGRIIYRARDNAGNYSGIKWISIEDELDEIKVSVPTKVNMYITPYTLKKNQIWCEDFKITNLCYYDLDVNISSVTETIKKDNSDRKNIVKTTDLDFIIKYAYRETSIDINEGVNKDVYQCVLQSKFDSYNAMTFRFTGNLQGGSEKYWRDDDLKLEVVYDFTSREIKDLR